MLHANDADASYLGRVDPRARLLGALAFALVVAAAHRPLVLLLALAAAVLSLPLAGISPKTLVRRLLPLEILMAAIAVMMPLTTPGSPLWQFHRLAFSYEGLQLAGIIVLKANAIVVGMLGLLASMDANTLGHTLNHLYVPDKLTHLLLFTVRYLDVLDHEYRRLRIAMTVRGFRPRINMHTYRSLGHLVGMLLVHSFDRSERILAAMRCRGFHGHFFLFDHFAFVARRDLPFVIAWATILATLVGLEWR